MVDHKLKGVLGSRDKSFSHVSSHSLAMEEKLIANLETFAQHLRLYEYHMPMENLNEGIGKYKIKEKKYDFFLRDFAT